MKSDSSGEAKPRRRASGFFVRAEGGAARFVTFDFSWSVALNTDPNTIRRWLRGDINSPTLSAKVPKLCPVLLKYKGNIVTPNYK